MGETEGVSVCGGEEGAKNSTHYLTHTPLREEKKEGERENGNECKSVCGGKGKKKRHGMREWM